MSFAKCAGGVAVMALLFAPLPSRSGTIAPGEIRVVRGTVSAVDVVHRAVVVDVPRGTGSLTVGVTLAPSASPEGPAGPLSLSEVQPGASATLRYTREDDRLVGLALRIRR